MLNTGQVLLIRPHKQLEYKSKSSHEFNKKKRALLPSFLKKCVFSTSYKFIPQIIKDNCYMGEYEKSKIAIVEFENFLDELDEKIKNNKTENLNLNHRHQLIYQFDIHYLYRLSHKDNHHHHNKSNSNYSQCSEKFILNDDDKEQENLEINHHDQNLYDNLNNADERKFDELEKKDGAEKENNNNTVVGKVQRRFRRDMSKADVYSKTFTIETIIFVDASLIARFNGNREELQKLIFAIMNEVQLIYNFDSLKIRIRILIKQIVYLENRDAPNTADGDIDLYLDNFCAWQKRLWLKANRTARWDHALMLTGYEH